ncbi:hypothetical protein QBC34DRAFT_385471 [Podospora aff. communis PSN243]|uniref:Uncharacterized protein n=1 Tax=Podospora aff. communis PSN243 TaxID=3040156 RepID=A0AAV9G9G0_9PEZI|nr:hypothetical protein QBC34DRAFT_385471 [Podospora aff. communis PSN243]
MANASLEDEPRHQSREVTTSAAGEQWEQPPDPPARVRTTETLNSQPLSADRPGSPASLYVASRVSMSASTLATPGVDSGSAGAPVELDATPIAGQLGLRRPANVSASTNAQSYSIDPDVTRRVRGLENASRGQEAIVSEQAHLISLLEEANAKLKQDKMNIIGDVKELQQTNDHLLAQVDDLRDMLASRVTPAVNSGSALIPDTHVHGRWNELCFDIRQCVAEHVKTPGGAWYGRNANLPHFARLTPDPIVFLSTINGCHQIAEAVIWDVIARNVFGNGDNIGKLLWAGKLSTDLGNLLNSGLQRMEQEQEKAFHTWRRQTATYFRAYSHPKAVQAHVDLLINEVDSKLRSQSLLNGRGKTFKKQLERILFDALSLDRDLLQQSAFWFVRYPDTDQSKRYGVLYSEDTMKLITMDNESPLRVDLMISPALFKAGDSHGENYGHVEVACKSTVSACGVSKWRVRLPVLLGGVPEGADPSGLTGLTRMPVQRRASASGRQGGKWRGSRTQLG